MTDLKGKLGDSDYTWAEDRPGGGGGGPRGIKIMGPGLGTNGVVFRIDPNPHDNAAYNKSDGQEQFYQGFAKKISANWPTKAEVKFKDVKDVGDVAKSECKGINFTKMSRSQQINWLKNHNEEKKAAEIERIKTEYQKAVSKHVAERGGTSFTLGETNYVLKAEL